VLRNRHANSRLWQHLYVWCRPSPDSAMPTAPLRSPPSTEPVYHLVVGLYQ
jgi:hypothetical protein